jgi:hypothetical protein
MKKPQPNRLGFLWSVQCALGEASDDAQKRVGEILQDE